MNIYVGNLSRDVTEDELRQAFTAFGRVLSVNIMKDRRSGQSKGFGFIEMPAELEGQAAIDGLKGQTLQDRTLDISEVYPRSGKKGGGPYRGKGNKSYGGKKGKQRR